MSNDPVDWTDPLGLTSAMSGKALADYNAAQDAAMENSLMGDLDDFLESFSVYHMGQHPGSAALEIGVGIPSKYYFVRGLQQMCPMAGNIAARALPLLGIGIMIVASAHDAPAFYQQGAQAHQDYEDSLIDPPTDAATAAATQANAGMSDPYQNIP